MIIDTHMHIFDERYENTEEIINNALENNVKKMIVVGFDKESSLKALELSKKYDFIYLSVGLHPSEVKKEEDKELSWLTDILKSEKVVSVGEIGLDYYWDKSFKDEQKYYFEKQIEIAKEYDLPIIVHCRDAVQDCYNILKDSNVKGVMHCYSGSLEMAREFTKKGYYLGIGGVVTFKNAVEIKKVVEGIDLSYLLSETDSPYLTPVPYRGKLNQPAYTKYVVEEIAKIKNLPVLEVEEILEENTKKLFGI